MIYSYRDLEVWKKGKDITREVYKTTSSFPKEELYGLVSQMRRSAVSIPANIAEGNGRNSSKEYLYHLSVAYGSLCELETHIIIAQELGMMDETPASSLLKTAGELGRMLNGLQRKITEKTTSNPRSLTSDPTKESL